MESDALYPRRDLWPIAAGSCDGGSGHHFPGAATNSLASHLIRDGIRRPVLAAPPLENLGQATGNFVNLGRDLGLGATAVVFARHTDDAAGIDHIVRRIEDAG